MQSIERLHVRKAFKENDAIDQSVAVTHFLDGFFAPFRRELINAPIFEKPVMKPVLIDRRQFMTQRVVEIFDDFRIALHGEVLLKRKSRFYENMPPGPPIRQALFREPPHNVFCWNLPIPTKRLWCPEGDRFS